MESRRRSLTWRVVWRAALKPANLLLLLLSLPLFLEMPAVGAIGVVVYASLVWHDASSRQFAQGVADELIDREDERVVPSAFREPIAAAEAARRRVRVTIEREGAALSGVLTPIAHQVDQVIERLYALAQRGERLDEFLLRQNRESISERLAALEQQAAAASDEYAREQYLQARQAREAQLRDYDDLALCRQRIAAQVANVLSSLEAAEAKVVRLQSVDLRDAGPAGDALERGLQDLSQEMAGLQQSVDATMAVRAHRAMGGGA